jgi:CHAT domain-containing protein
VRYEPLDAVIRRLLADLPEAAVTTRSLRIWPHTILHFLPFGAIRTLLPLAPAVSVMLPVEDTERPEVRYTASVRIAPAYEGDLDLPMAALEVTATSAAGDLIIAGTVISALEILRALRRSPALFHFAGHAINCNDYPELAGLYSSNSEMVTVADILSMRGYGPKAAVLSACETGPGPLHTPEGAYSLAHAFLMIGAAWVVASLWCVPDEPEVITIMQSFFNHLRNGRQPEDALPAGRHPFVVYRPSTITDQEA